jgi:hypothetical protein
METTIADRQVPVEDGPRTVVSFSAGCEKRDKEGNYDFWTLKNETGYLLVGRWPAGAPPGERFRHMEHNPADAPGWKDAQTAILLRSAAANELIDWLNDEAHAHDAPCATHGIILGMPMTVVRRANGTYDLEPA